MHRSGDLRERWVTTKDGLRCTDPHRTLQNELVNSGWTVLRYVWRDVEDQSPAVARGVVAALSRRRAELESRRVA